MNKRKFKKLIPFMEDLLDGKIIIIKKHIFLEHRIKPNIPNTLFPNYYHLSRIKDITKTKGGIPSICGQDLYFYF